MSTSNNLNFQVRRADNGESVSGLITFTAVRGTMVTHQLAADGTKKLVLANGQRGFHLERDVMVKADADGIFLSDSALGLGDFIRPDIINTDVSARRCQEVEVEGLDLISTSGTGAITNATALDTALGTLNGKYRVKQSGDELQGYLRGQLGAVADGTFRIMVEEVG